MPINKEQYSNRPLASGNGTHLAVSKKLFDGYSSSDLQLGSLANGGKQIEVVAAVFDLKDFTSFCSQNDPHLIIPEFLEKYLEWIYTEIKNETLAKTAKLKDTDEIAVWNYLPIYSKFLGDGVLFIWDISTLIPGSIGNIVVGNRQICRLYKTAFLPKISKDISKPPPLLRCGVARGKVFTVGDSKDYVGPCINLAARLQKISRNLPFAFSKKGLSFDKYFVPQFSNTLVTKRLQIRGVGDDELIGILAKDFEALPAEDKSLFVNP